MQKKSVKTVQPNGKIRKISRFQRDSNHQPTGLKNMIVCNSHSQPKKLTVNSIISCAYFNEKQPKKCMMQKSLLKQCNQMEK